MRYSIADVFGFVLAISRRQNIDLEGVFREKWCSLLERAKTVEGEL
jgi:hypothetical protein